MSDKTRSEQPKRPEQPEFDLGLEATVSVVMEARAAQHHGTLHDELASATKPDMIRIAPGRHAWVPKDKCAQPPKYVMCTWSKQADGTHVPIPVAGRLVKVCPDLLSLLGFNTGRRSSRYETLYRLANAGHIEMVRISPGSWLLDLDSWYRHLSVCMADPYMWDEDSEDRNHYLEVNALNHWKRAVGKNG